MCLSSYPLSFYSSSSACSFNIFSIVFPHHHPRFTSLFIPHFFFISLLPLPFLSHFTSIYFPLRHRSLSNSLHDLCFSYFWDLSCTFSQRLHCVGDLFPSGCRVIANQISLLTYLEVPRCPTEIFKHASPELLCTARTVLNDIDSESIIVSNVGDLIFFKNIHETK